METVTLSAVTRDQGCVTALKQGEVRAKGVTLEFVEVVPLVAAFRHMVREQRYDVCEMALTTYLCAREHGAPLTAIPAFIARGLHHGAMYRSTTKSIADPRDLHGERVGVNRGYTVTTGVWARSILADEYGVDLGAITWVRSSDEHVATYRPPANVETTDEPLLDLVRSGRLAAVVGTPPPTADTTTLIPAAQMASRESFRSRNLYPINHLVVIRDELLRQRPSLGVDLLDAFERSKQAQLAALRAGKSLHPTANDALHQQLMRDGMVDPLPFGVDSNAATLEYLLEQATSQGILRERPRLSQLFAPGTV